MQIFEKFAYFGPNFAKTFLFGLETTPYRFSGAGNTIPLFKKYANLYKFILTFKKEISVCRQGAGPGLAKPFLRSVDHVIGVFGGGEHDPAI